MPHMLRARGNWQKYPYYLKLTWKNEGTWVLFNYSRKVLQFCNWKMLVRA